MKADVLNDCLSHHTRRRRSLIMMALLMMTGASALHAQHDPLVTMASHATPWRTRYLEIAGTDGDGVIDHGAVRAGRVERRMLVINRFTDSVWFTLRGCCGNDYYSIDKEALAPGDTAHLTIGFDISNVNGPMMKSTLLEVRRERVSTHWSDSTELLTFRTKVRHHFDLTLVPASYVIINDTVGRPARVIITIVASADRPIDLRASVTEQPAHATLRLRDTSAHRLKPGDTLRLAVEVAGVSRAGVPPEYENGYITLVTSSAQLPRVIVTVLVRRGL
jgi:hypothetical protein